MNGGAGNSRASEDGQRHRLSTNDSDDLHDTERTAFRVRRALSGDTGFRPEQSRGTRNRSCTAADRPSEHGDQE